MLFSEFFFQLRKEGLPVSLVEYLTLLEGLDKGVCQYSVDDFYYWSRTALIKNEAHLDRFDKIFGEYFGRADLIPDKVFDNIAEKWLNKDLSRMFSKEEMEKIEKMGGMDELMKRLNELLKEQKEKHEGGNKWIGSGGTSPFGSQGFNPEGFRWGPDSAGNRTAIKVWDKRDFANLDDRVELETRNIKMALRRLRHFTREGALEELDIDGTIRKTSDNGGILDVHLVPSRKNKVKVLLFLDAGGSMDDHVEICSRLFSAAKYEFKHLEFFYFHNCIYESVWRDNRRRSARIPTFEVLHKYNRDYKVIIVGDAAMSPYEIVSVGGSVEHYNDEAGSTWLQRIREQYPYVSWINPVPDYNWSYFQSTGIIREIMGNRMFPMTIDGLVKTMASLKSKRITHDEIWL